MKPNLKTRKLYQCTCDEEGKVIDRQLIDITYYNEAGFIAKQEGYQDGELATTIENEYEGSNLIKFKQLDYIFETEQVVENKFDDNNRKVEQIEHFQGGGFSKIRFEYDDKGRLVKEYSEDDEGQVDHRVEFDYDDKGNLLESREFDAEDPATPWITKTYEHDENGNITKFTESYRDQEATTREYTHNEKGELLTVQMYYTVEEDLIMEQQNIRDENGLLLKQAMFHYKEQMKREEVLKYNEKNELLETETLINGNFHSTRQTAFNEMGDVVLEKELLPVRGGNGFMQWSAIASELEYWDAPEMPHQDQEE